MFERRQSRSKNESEALKLLLEAVRGRSEISAIALVDARGLVISGSGTLRELAVLGTIAAPAAHGLVGAYEQMTRGTDVLAREIETKRGTLYLAALGNRVTKMVDAARGVQRIMRAA